MSRAARTTLLLVEVAAAAVDLLRRLELDEAAEGISGKLTKWAALGAIA